MLIGIGDDGAVINSEGQPRQVIVTDMLLDGVHFDLNIHPAHLCGRKAVAVNLSDLAAMGCRPTAAFVSIAIPRSLGTKADDFLDQIYAGMEELARQFDFTIAGGDTNVWNGPFAINVCCTGVPFGDRVFLRSTAQPGDIICVTGPLGGSYESGRHLTFTPRLAEAEWLSKQDGVHAVMDISDGLLIDLQRMCEASGVGASLDFETIPRNKTLDGRVLTVDAIDDGEDFELLYTLRDASQLCLSDLPEFCTHRIGRIVAQQPPFGPSEQFNSGECGSRGWEHQT